ncbi:MAG TPA: cytochrome C oxidase subunit IV family protein [Anaeromyxobacter sp.]|nr:cytochrome C oxidase subunit IV family protein [Anaeromyxobacter sp.]
MAERGSVAMEEHERVGHHSHVGRYVVVWAALLVLTLATWALSRLHLPGGWAIFVALLIASSKGALVALFFMHLWDQTGANRLVFMTSLVFVALLILIVLSDNSTRFRLANPPGSEGALPFAPTDYSMGAAKEPGPSTGQGAPLPR